MSLIIKLPKIEKCLHNKIRNWRERHGHTAQQCKSKQQSERFPNSQKERRNAAIEEEDYIDEVGEDYQSDNESVAEVGFVATVTEDKDGTALACVIDGVSYQSFTEDTMFGDSGSSCHIRNTMEGMFDMY